MYRLVSSWFLNVSSHLAFSDDRRVSVDYCIDSIESPIDSSSPIQFVIYLYMYISGYIPVQAPESEAADPWRVPNGPMRVGQ